MPTFTGRIDLGGMTYPCPTGMAFTVAVDGTYHVCARGDGAGPFLQIASVDTLTAEATTKTNLEFRQDVEDELGLTNGGAPTQHVNASEFWNAPNTSEVFIAGNREAVDFGGGEVFILRYTVAAEGVITVSGKYRYRHGAGSLGALDGGGWGGPIGELTSNNGQHFYYLGGFGNSGFGFRVQLAKIPLTEDQIDLTDGSWDLKRYDLPAGDMTATSWWADVSRDTKNLASLYEIEPDLIGVINYKTVHEGEASSKLWQTEIATAASGPGTGGNGKNDISALFNLPWDDEGFDFDGLANGSGENYYTNPYIGILPNGRLEWIFGRGDTANRGVVRYRRFTSNPDLSDIVADAVVTIDIATSLGVTGTEAVHFDRVGNKLVIMIRENPALTFGEIEVSVDECVSSGFDITYPPCVTAWTQCVKIQRRDGVTFRFTSLDQDISFRGETYVTCGGLDPSATQVTAQLGEVGSTELAGLIVATGVKETELYGGLFDDAFVEIWLVPFDTPENLSSGDGELPRRLAAGWAGKVSHSTRGYKMEVLGPGARLDQRPIVQVYSPQCRWVFGDERCGIDIETMAVTGTVTSGINRGSILAILGDPLSSGTGAPESSGTLPAQFANGKIRWLTGVNAGQVCEVKSVDFDTGAIILWALTCFVPEVGDTFDLLPGCAQDFATCRDVYDNALRNGGFPYVPGRDAISETPNAKL